MGELPGPGDGRRRDPAERPAPADPGPPRPLQQHLALVPAERHRPPRSRGRVLRGAGVRGPRAGARGGGAREGGGMTFFERYFAALDGPEPYSSLGLVADDLE